MTKLATNFATVRKAIGELRKIESFLFGGPVSKRELKIALQEISDFSNIVASEADAALAVVRETRKRVSAYERKLLDAVG